MNNPKKPKPAPAPNPGLLVVLLGLIVPAPEEPVVSIREKNALRRASFLKDDEANVNPGLIAGLVIGGALGGWLVFMLDNMVQGAANSNVDKCATWYAGDTPGIAQCKERQSNALMVWSVGSFVLILAGVGLGGVIGHKTGAGAGATVAVTFGTILSGVIGTWLVFMFGGMIEGQAATTRANCETWYPVATEAADHAKCKEGIANKLQIWSIAQFLLVLASCGLGAVGTHFGTKAARSRFGRRRSGGGGGFRPRGRGTY